MAPDGRPLTGASVRAAVGLPISLDPLPELTRVQTAWWPLMQRKIRSPGWGDWSISPELPAVQPSSPTRPRTWLPSCSWRFRDGSSQLSR